MIQREAERDGDGAKEESAGSGRRSSASKGEAIAELMLEVAQFFFRLRAVGQRTGLITSWGAGAFGFMRSLALIGPLTVPQIAKMRPTSRQRMQRLADELAAEGLVEFIDNPRHRRSKLVRLTREGDARYRELSARLRAMASTMGADLSEVDIRRTTDIVRRLSDETKGRSERSPRSPGMAVPAGSGAHDSAAASRQKLPPRSRKRPAARGDR